MSLHSLARKPFLVLKERELEMLRILKIAFESESWDRTHAHENARFVFVLRGSFTETYPHGRRTCSPFTMIVRPPQEEHADQYHRDGGLCLSVDIQPRWMERLRQYSVKLDDSASFRGQALTTLILNLDREFQVGDGASVLAIEGLLLEIAVEAFRHKSMRRGGKAPRWLAQARDYLHAHFDTSLTLGEISASVGVHPASLARAFRQHYHCTVAEYLRLLRIEAACSAIASSDAPLAQIAINAGFSDQSHLSKTFKRLTRMTPAEYRAFARSR